MIKILLICLLTFSFLNANNSISQQTFKKLQSIQKFIDKMEYNKALKLINSIINSNLNNISKTYSYQSLSNIYMQKDEYSKVISTYEKILFLKAFKIEDLDKIKFQLTKICLAQSLFKKTITYSKELFNSKVIKRNSLYENIALANYYNAKYSKAIPYINKVLFEKIDKENWYRMLYSSYIELKDYDNAISTLEIMINKYSKKEEYWMQLISLYQNKKRYKKALGTFELAYEKNVLNKEKNIMYFLNLLLQHNLYNKTALVIKDALKKNILEQNEQVFKILISSLLNSKNNKEAIELLQSSKYAKNEKYQLVLGNLYFSKNEYKKTIKVLNSYKFKTNSLYEGQKYILLALSSYELENKKESRKYLKEAILNIHKKKKALSIAKSLGFKI